MKIDIDKFICDLIDVETDHRITVAECCRIVNLTPLAMSICDALQKQGLEVVNGTLREIKGNDGEISPNEETTGPTKKSEQDELTEFEKALARFSWPGLDPSALPLEGRRLLNNKRAKAVMNAARKQIVSEIDIEKMKESFIAKDSGQYGGALGVMFIQFYQLGIKHCLQEIELKTI